MSSPGGTRARWVVLILLVTMAFGSSAMTASAHKPHGDHGRGGGPPAVDHGKTKKLQPAPDMPAQLVAQDVTCAPATVDMKVLVLTPPDNNPRLSTITSTLDYLGTPYDVVLAGQTPITPALLANDCHANYQAVMLTDGSLYDSTTGGTALTADEWAALWTYEATFDIRQVSWYTFPNADYGFQAPSGAVDTTDAPLQVTFTSAGKTAFPYVNTANPLTISYAYTYQAKPLDSATTPWLVDRAGNALAAVRAYPDGRQNLALTFDSNANLTHAIVLGYGVVNWATKGLFLGQRHVYMSAQIDDVLLEDDIWTPGTVCTVPTDQTGAVYRVTDKDMQALLAWQTNVQRQAISRALKLDMAFNGWGTTSDDDYDNDKLTPWVQANESAFKWISHTWDHENLDEVDYAAAYAELKQNIDIANAFPRKPSRRNPSFGGLDLRTFSRLNLVTPDVSGLNNLAFLQAAKDLGIRYLVSDTSRDGNPSPNTGTYNQYQPSILEIPRRPVNLFYNVSTPAEWVAEYNCIYGPNGVHPFWDHDFSYNEILDNESTVLLGYLLRGEVDPWMFHQPNLRAYDGRHSLLGDLLDRTLAKYNALYKTPLVSPTMDQLGQTIANRMQYNAAGVTATLTPGVSITLTAQQAVTIPVTGLATTGAESYGGQFISYIRLNAGQSVTLPLR